MNKKQPNRWFDLYEPDPVGVALRTGMYRFVRGEIDGLCRVTGDCIELLAIRAHRKGQGYFREFISDCKRRFRTVIVWHIGNPIVENALTRYGFVATQKYEADEKMVGMIWIKQQ